MIWWTLYPGIRSLHSKCKGSRFVEQCHIACLRCDVTHAPLYKEKYDLDLLWVVRKVRWVVSRAGHASGAARLSGTSCFSPCLEGYSDHAQCLNMNTYREVSRGWKSTWHFLPRCSQILPLLFRLRMYNLLLLCVHENLHLNSGSE